MQCRSAATFDDCDSFFFGIRVNKFVPFTTRSGVFPSIIHVISFRVIHCIIDMASVKKICSCMCQESGLANLRVPRYHAYSIVL